MKNTQKNRSKNHQKNYRKIIYCLIAIAALLLIAICAVLYLSFHKKPDTFGASATLTANSDISPDHSKSPEPVTEYIRMSELTAESNSNGANDANVIFDPADSSTDAPTSTDMSKENDTTVTSSPDIKTNPCSDLSVPTYITKVDDTYFLVDCYHNQVIYNDTLTAPLYEWKVMTDDIDKGHTLASDGIVYLIDDTERHRILIFEKKDDTYIHTQTFHEIGNRPHYIIYDAPTDTFYAWSSMSGEMYLFRHNPDDSRMYLTEIRRIESLDNVYVRSFTIVGNDIYFVSGNSSIIRADLESFEILDTYPVPASMAGMIQLTPIQDYFYITVSTDITGNQDYATMIRTRDLSTLTEGDYEDVYDNFIGGGTPYYITFFDDAYYLTEHRLPGHSVWRFEVEDNVVKNVETVY